MSCMKKRSTNRRHSRKLTNLFPYDVFFKPLLHDFLQWNIDFFNQKADEIWWCLEDFWIFSCHWSWLEKQVTYGKCLCDSERICLLLMSIMSVCCTYIFKKKPLDKGRHSKQCKVNHSWSLSCLNGVWINTWKKHFEVKWFLTNRQKMLHLITTILKVGFFNFFKVKEKKERKNM